MKLTVRQPSAALDAKHYTTERLRSEYVIETIFVADEAVFTYSHLPHHRGRRHAGEYRCGAQGLQGAVL